MDGSSNANDIKILSWVELELFYNHWISVDNYSDIIDLIRYIKSTDLSNRLYASTSLTTLTLSIYNPIVWHTETLHISFDRVLQSWNFERERQYKDDLIGNFDKYILSLKW